MSSTLVGRNDELGAIEVFLGRAEEGPSALVFSGEPGIGKTILWEATVERARRGSRVLSCRCLETEAQFSFGSLTDLIGPVFGEVVDALPLPRREALNVALLLAEPGDEPVSSRAIGLGLLDAINKLAERAPLIIAVDDLQWLDSSTWTVLQMALRRLTRERIGFLATVRETRGVDLLLQLDRSLPEGRLSRVSLGPLSLGALHRVLSTRLGLELTRPQLVRVAEATGGNPFFALEVGRELVRTHVRPQPRQPLPVPATLGALLERRLEQLPAQTRLVLVAVAALARPTVDLVAAAQPEPIRVMDSLGVAAREGVIALEGSRIRFAHPLLASACYEASPQWQRREVHQALAAVVEDDEERVRHRALAATGEDADLAADLEAAAITASSRGSNAAAELLELAAELTPRKDGRECRRRSMAAALFYGHAGETEHGVALLEQLLPHVPAGAERADVLLVLAGVAPSGVPATLELCDEALREAAGDDAREIRVLATRTTLRASIDVGGALADGRTAVERAEALSRSPISERPSEIDAYAPAGLLRAAIARLAYVETCALAETAGLVERGVELEAGLRPSRHVTYWDSPTAMLAHRLMLRDELDRARELLEAKEAQLTSDGARKAVHQHLAWLEWLSGRWQRAREHANEAVELAGLSPGTLTRAGALQAAAFVAAYLGEVHEARPKAEEALGIARAASHEVLGVECLGVLGQLELALGNVDAAAGYLRELPDRLLALGWNDPSSPLWPDTIETLVRAGDHDDAHACLVQYEERAQRASLRTRACAARSRGLLLAAGGDLDGASEALDCALVATPPPSYPFERARTLLALGELHRQARRRGAARGVLEEALAIFGELGAQLWLEQARTSLRRISGRRAGSGRLTETEQRVAALAAEGLSNKEIAAALFMSVHTVEAHLTRVYRKLGLRSRAALAHRLAAGSSGAVKQ